MHGENVISDKVMEEINSELHKGNNWMAYNTVPYCKDTGDVYLFNSKDEAIDFSKNNVSEFDSYKVIRIEAIDDAVKQIFPGELLYPITEKVSDHGHNTLQSTTTQKILNQTNSYTQKTNFMNEKNFDYLKDQLKFTGFGEGLENELKEKIQKQTSEFRINHNARFGDDDLTATLHFKKSDQTDMYFFNSYRVNLKPEQSSEAMEQTFYINKGNNITLKEAFNLMNGRAVNKDLTNKEGEVYNAWMQMDFKQTENNGNYKMKLFHQNYGYDLPSALARHPIKELSTEPDKSRLLDSLQKGNRQSVTFIEGGGEQKHFIEANPKFKTINIYVNHVRRFNHMQGQNEKQAQGEQNSVKEKGKNESEKQGDTDDGDAAPKASNKRKKKQNHSIG